MASTRTALEELQDAIGKAFETIRAAAMPPTGAKRLTFGWYTSIPGLYESACRSAGGTPRAETVDNLLDIASSYLDALQSRVEAEMMNLIVAADTSSRHDVVEPDADRAGEVLDKASADLQRIIDTESQRARQIGAVDGISEVAAGLGDDDPTVFFVVVRDDSLCDECRRLHLLPDGRTPRVWKLSQLSADYHRKGGELPSVQGLHPHCRCSQTYLAPGFGFNAAGYVRWVSQGHDEYLVQRSA